MTHERWQPTTLRALIKHGDTRPAELTLAVWQGVNAIHKMVYDPWGSSISYTLHALTPEWLWIAVSLYTCIAGLVGLTRGLRWARVTSAWGALLISSVATVMFAASNPPSAAWIAYGTATAAALWTTIRLRSPHSPP